jgi:cellulose synthase/poly-beta-1,6-N-acetylglucosamine synthase-like glycosyltransferase
MSTLWVTLFLASALAIVYVLAGYPLLLAWLARRFEKPVQRREHVEPVTVVIAVRNGERWLSRKLESVLAQDYPANSMDVLVVSDGSSDGTDRIAASYAGRGVRLLRVPFGGKPAALNAAVPQASGGLLFFTDARQVLRLDCLRRLVAAMADPAVGVVSGDLRIARGARREEANTGLYWRYENWIRGNLSRLHSMLGATGPVYLIRKSLYAPIPPNSLLDDVFLPLSVHLQGYRLVIEPDAVAIDEPTDLATEFRRKVRTQAGIIQLLGTFPGLFSARNRMRFHFVSLKIGRLLLPFFLALLLAASFGLPSPWRWIAVAPQLAFWALALIDPAIPDGSVGKKLTSLPRAFAVLVWAAACAWKILFVSPRELWVEARSSEAPGAPGGDGSTGEGRRGATLS